MLGAARVVTEAANPWIGYVATVGTAIIALLAYRLSQRQNRVQQRDAELLRFKAELDRDNTIKGIYGALWGHTEGTTNLPGLVEVVVGDGNGSGTVRDIANGARREATAAAERAEAATEKAGDLALAIGHAVATVNDHVEEDKQIHEDQRRLLEDISAKLQPEPPRIGSEEGRRG